MIAHIINLLVVNISGLSFSNHDGWKGKRKIEFSLFKNIQLVVIYFNVDFNPKPLYYHLELCFYRF